MGQHIVLNFYTRNGKLLHAVGLADCSTSAPKNRLLALNDDSDSRSFKGVTTVAMIQENEILTLVLGAGVLHFIIINYQELKEKHSIGLLVPSFCMLFT